MKNKFREIETANKGITLIALIITVIVLLILAGTAISISINGGDIFSKASQAREGWNTAIANEQTNLDSVLSILNTVADGTPSDLPAGWYENAVDSAYPSASSLQKAPIPKGFKVSIYDGETTIEGGLVIYNTNGVDLVADAQGESTNHNNAMETYDQYVWIPVADINDMVMCKSRTDASECDIDFVDGELKCKNHSATEYELCGRLYDPNIDYENPTVTDGKSFYSGTMTTTKSGQAWNESDYHEPDLVTDYDLITPSAYTQIESDFYFMAESIATYGGFYIARYEAQENAGSKKGQAVITAATNDQMWYGLYGTLRRQIKFNGTTTLVGQMIWGSQFDQVIKFIGNEAQTGHSYQATNLSSSGANSSDNLKNIYDLEGNFIEWIATAFSTNCRTIRGGFSGLAVRRGEFYPASDTNHNVPNDKIDGFCSRQSLYVPLRDDIYSLNGANDIIYRDGHMI